VLGCETLPFDEVPKLPVHHLTVQYLFYYPFFFAVDDLGKWRRRCMSAEDWILRGGCQFDNIEYRMNATHGRG
jgi:hypothetical protein